MQVASAPAAWPEPDPGLCPSGTGNHMSIVCRFDEWTAYGKVGGIDDPSMGWARYAQVPLLFHFSV